MITICRYIVIIASAVHQLEVEVKDNNISPSKDASSFIDYDIMSTEGVVRGPVVHFGSRVAVT